MKKFLAVMIVILCYINYKQNERLNEHKRLLTELTNNQNKTNDYLRVKEYEKSIK